MNAPTINDGGPAFPHPQGWRRDPEISDGMSLRDYFAGQVIGHLVCAPERTEHLKESDAHYAYQVADAMLDARSKRWIKA
jgi:hypothetical protein